MKKIIIVGRENVGKSTLFNKLCHNNLAIVNNQPGITRDYIQNVGKLFDLKFELIDTAGWSFKKKDEITQQIKLNTTMAIDLADIIFFVVDAKTFLTDEDIMFAKVIKKNQKQIFLLANKAESKVILEQKALNKLGFGDGIFISAEHRLGFSEIYESLNNNFKQATEIIEANKDNLSIAIIGRPNVGKSSLFNTILGFERSLVSDTAGTTRDYLIYTVNTNGSNFKLIDTAGVRRKSKIQAKIEELSIGKTISAIRISDVVLLIMDSENTLEKQDLVLANLVLKNNKLLIPVINKQDLISDLSSFKDEMNYLFQKKLPQVKDIFAIFISTQKEFHKKLFFNQINRLWNLYNIKISTSKLNNWLNNTLATYSMPITKNNIKLKIKYVQQTSSCPPTFVFFVNLTNKIHINENFKKFLINSLCAQFSLKGIPVKVHFIASKNPYIARL